MSNIPSSLYAVELERTCLGGLIKNPKTIIELSNFIGESDFFYAEHRIIFAVLKSLVLGGHNVDKVILAQKCRELNLNQFNDLDIFSYCDSISYTQLNSAGVQSVAKELIKLRVKREIFSNALEVQEMVKSSGDKSINEIIGSTDAIYSKKISSFDGGDAPNDLTSNIEEMINERGRNPVNDVGILTPFKYYNDMFGGLKVGTSFTVGRAKSGKSTFLLNLAWGAILNNPNLSVFYLDTELKSETNQFRLASAFSQVPQWFLETGSWSKNFQLAEQLKGSWNTINKLKGKLFHQYVGNKPIEEVSLIIKRWFYSKVGKNNPALIIFDYIKMGDEKVSNNVGEHQILGNKINRLNELSNEINCPIFSSCQLNRTAITENRDDESAISMTDRLSWFANSVSIFRKKRPEELQEEGGLKFGTHKLIPVLTRFQGKDASILDFVKTIDHNGKTRYKQNFINFEVSSFLLKEKGTLTDVVKDQQLNQNLQKDNKQNKDINI